MVTTVGGQPTCGPMVQNIRILKLYRHWCQYLEYSQYYRMQVHTVHQCTVQVHTVPAGPSFLLNLLLDGQNIGNIRNIGNIPNIPKFGTLAPLRASTADAVSCARPPSALHPGALLWAAGFPFLHPVQKCASIQTLS